MQRSLGIVVLVASFTALSGCEGGRDAGLTFGVASAPVTLDPRHAADAQSMRLARLLYRAPVALDAQGLPHPDLATWSWVNPLTLALDMRETDARFADGRPVTAEDVAATYRFLIDPDHGSPHRAALDAVADVRMADARTVVFHLAHEEPLLPAYLTVPVLPASAIAAGHPFDDEPVPSGVFRLAGTRGPLRLELRRDDGMRVDFQVVRDPAVRALKLVKGEIDLLQGDLPPELAGWLERQPGLVTRRLPGATFAYLGFNLEDPVAGDARVRRAIAHAIDREGIVRHLFGGRARVAGALFPPEHWLGIPATEGVTFDPQRARALLAEAGYGAGKRVALTWKTSSDPFRLRLATFIAAQLAEVGIDARIQSYDWGTFFGDIRAGRFQMYSLSWVGVRTPDIFRYAFHSTSLPPQGANRGRLHDHEIDALIEAGEAARTLDEKALVYRRLQTALDERQVYVPLWYEDQFTAARAVAGAYRPAPDGGYDALALLNKAHE